MNIFYKQSAEGKSLRVCTLPFILFLAIVACNHDVPTPEGETVETPRRIAAADGKLYVSCYRPASVIRIDTASHTVEAQCLLGTCNPEGVAVAAGSLFVASSWNQTSNGDFIYDDKVYVVDLTSFAVSATVTVGLNPQQVKVIDENHVIVNYEGNYADLPGGTAIIDVASLDVTQTGLHMASMSVCDGKVYGYSTSYDSDMHPTAEYVCYDPATATATPILRDCGVTRPYSINVFGGNIYLTTDGGYTSNGDVQCFAIDGTRRWQCEAGMLPSKVLGLGDGSAYVLNEGTWGSNNASLSRVDLATGSIDNTAFTAANGRGLGDVAQDMLLYGGKVYVTVSFSNTIEVVDPSDNSSVQIRIL